MPRRAPKPNKSSLDLDTFRFYTLGMSSKSMVTLPVGMLLDACKNAGIWKTAFVVLGITIQEFEDWVNNPETPLDPYTADSYAHRIGLHPFNIWGWSWVDHE